MRHLMVWNRFHYVKLPWAMLTSGVDCNWHHKIHCNPLSKVQFFHHKVHNHFCDEHGPVVTIHITGLHWVKCFICNAVLATKCTNTWSLIIAYIIVHVISMIFQITEYLFMPTYFITFYGMTVYVNISVIYPLIQADPSRPSDRMAAKFWSSLLQPMACPPSIVPSECLNQLLPNIN